MTFILSLYTFLGLAQDYNTLYKEGVRLVDEKEFAQAAKVFERALPLAGEAARFKTLVNLAYSQLMTGAVDSYTKALELKPGETALLFQRANAYLQLERYDKAIEDCNGIMEQHPDNSAALLISAQAYMLKGEYDKAKDGFVKVMTLEPENTNAKLGLVQVYQKKEMFNEALALIGLMIEEEPSNPTLYIVRSDIEREMGLYELALLDNDEAIKLWPENPEYYTLRAILYEKLDNKKEAEACELAEKKLDWLLEQYVAMAENKGGRHIEIVGELE